MILSSNRIAQQRSLMRFSLRWARMAIVLAAIVIFSGGICGSARAQEFDSLFAKARQLEKDGKKQEALREYDSVYRSQGSNREGAAEALYQGGQFASERFG